MASGSELGSAHVSIFPQMKGFRQNVAKETGKAVSDLKTPFQKGSTGRSRASRSQRLQNGFNSGAAELNSDALRSFKKDVAQASQKNTDALLKFKAASVQVQAAQEKLNAATQKYGADSTGAGRSHQIGAGADPAEGGGRQSQGGVRQPQNGAGTAQGPRNAIGRRVGQVQERFRPSGVRLHVGGTADRRQDSRRECRSAEDRRDGRRGRLLRQGRFSSVWNALPEGARNAATKAGSALHSGLSKASGFASKAVSGIGNAAKGMATVVSGAATAAAAYPRQLSDASPRCGAQGRRGDREIPAGRQEQQLGGRRAEVTAQPE